MDLRQIFPEKFQFYHLGFIELETHMPTPWQVAPDQQALGYAIRGDWNGVLLVSFSSDLDTSTYSEVGNILVSQITQRLCHLGYNDVMPGAPQTLRSEQISRLLQGSHTLRQIHSQYRHHQGQTIIAVETLLIESATQIGEIGNA